MLFHLEQFPYQKKTGSRDSRGAQGQTVAAGWGRCLRNPVSVQRIFDVLEDPKSACGLFLGLYVSQQDFF